MYTKVFNIVKSRSFTSLFLRVMGMGFSYLFSLMVTRKCGAEGWGIISLIFTIVLLGSYILKFGFDTALLRFAAENEAMNKRGLTYAIYRYVTVYLVSIAALVSIILFISSDYIASDVFHKNNLTDYLPFASVLIVPAILTLVNAEGLRGLGKVYQYSVYQNSTALGITAFILYVLSYTDSKMNWTYTVLIVYTISVFVLFFVSQVTWLRNVVVPDAEKTQVVNIRNIMKVAMPMFLSGAMLIIIGWADTIILGIISTEKEVGIYNVALRICNLVIIGKLALNSIVAGKYAHLFTIGSIKELEIFARDTSKKILLTSAPVFLLLVLFPGFFLGLFGNEFKEGSLVLIILSAGQFINSACGTPDVLLQMTGYENIYKNIMIVAVVINLTLNMILIPVAGMTGAGIASFIGLSFLEYCKCSVCKEKIGNKYPLHASITKF